MSPHELAATLESRFSLRGIKRLCLKLDIDYENISGETLSEKATELALFCQRRHRLPDLEQAIHSALNASIAVKLTNLFLPFDSFAFSLVILGIVAVIAVVILGGLFLVSMTDERTPAAPTAVAAAAAGLSTAVPTASPTTTFTPTPVPDTPTPTETPTITLTPTRLGANFPYYLIVLDASSRMAARSTDGASKWDTVQASMLGLLSGSLPKDANYGLFVLGINREGISQSCGSAPEAILPLAPGQFNQTVSTIFGLRPQGEADLTAAIQQALIELTENLPEESDKVLLVITGGGDCNPESPWQSLELLIELAKNLPFRLKTELVILTEEEAAVDPDVLQKVDDLVRLNPELVNVVIASPEDVSRVIENTSERIVPTPTPPIRVIARPTASPVPTNTLPSLAGASLTPTATAAPSLPTNTPSSPLQTATPGSIPTVGFSSTATPTTAPSSTPTLPPMPTATLTPSPSPTLMPTFTATPTAVPLVIDNFNDGQDPNGVGGVLEWFLPETIILPTPTPPVNCAGVTTVSSAYDSTNRFGSSGYGYRLTYEGVTPSCYATWQVGIQGPDLSEFSFVSFQIRGSVNGCPQYECQPNIYLQKQSNQRAMVNLEDYLSGGVTAQWQKVRIPLSAYVSQGIELTDLSYFQIVFEWGHLSGTVYIDNIQFED